MPEIGNIRKLVGEVAVKNMGGNNTFFQKWSKPEYDQYCKSKT